MPLLGKMIGARGGGGDATAAGSDRRVRVDGVFVGDCIFLERPLHDFGWMDVCDVLCYAGRGDEQRTNARSGIISHTCQSV